MRGIPSAKTLVSSLSVGVAVYLCIATVLDQESNFVLFLWRAFAPTTSLFVFGYIFIRLLRARHLKKAIALRERAFISLLMIASMTPIARCWRDFITPQFFDHSNSHHLTVFDMNLLGHRDVTPAVLPEIKRRAPDIVLLQEVTSEIADKINDALKADYPCRVFDPRPGSYGMATLALHPCQRLDFVSQGSWVGRPQITQVLLPDNRSIISVNLHGIHPHALIDREGDEGLAGKLSNTVSAREESISELLTHLRKLPDLPVVIAGDLNATMRNRVYSLIRGAGYNDSWLTTQPWAEKILGGGTWPFPEYGIPSIVAWLLRIDFIFLSQHLVPLSTEVLPASLGSDHRGLVTRFR